MENITVGQILSVITTLTIIVGFFLGIFKWYKTHFTDRFKKIEDRVTIIENMELDYRKVAQDSKEERLILLEGLLACLKGLKEQGCNDSVTTTIVKVEKYMIEKSHE